VRKLSIIILGAAAIVAASPAAAQDNRRPSRVNCSDQNPCVERRGAFLWFYLGQDEGQRPPRRVTRRLALDD